MKLDKKERLNLMHQFLILEKLYPEDADYFAKHRKAIAEGYELHYKWIFENLWEGLSEDQCKLVLDVLDMYRALHYASEKSTNPAIKEHMWLKFSGFDGNNESSYMAYCRYFMFDLERFNELKYGKEFPDLNSHMPTLGKYTAMLNSWQRSNKKFELNDEEAMIILEAADHG